MTTHAILLVLLLALTAEARVLRGTVTRASDGDTITVTNKHTSERVRFAATDAPEKGQPFFAEAQRELAARLLNQTVRVVWKRRDRNGRPVGRVFLNRQDQGIDTIRSGFAWYYPAYERELSPRDRVRYQRAQDEARAARRGLWNVAVPNEDNPIAPWLWRAAHR